MLESAWQRGFQQQLTMSLLFFSGQAHKSESIILSQAFDDFLNTRTLKDRTIRDYRRTMEVAFADWQQRRVLDITRDMVSKRHGKLGKEQGSAQANQHMRVLRALLNFGGILR